MSITHQFEDCWIIDCSERFAPFAGHRGSLARFGPTRNEHPWDFYKVHERFLGLYAPIEFPTTFFSRGLPYTMSGKYETYNYIGVQRYYFIAPKTGTYEFLYSSDDWLRVRIMV